jgi:aquaporin Z
MDTGRKLLAEGIGTFFLCFAGIAAIVNAHNNLLGVALAHGIALSVAVSCFGGISGGLVNPALTIGFLVTGRIKPLLAVLYIVSQLVGATLAALACKWMFPAEAVESAQLGIPLPGAWVSLPVLLGTEAILTFLLMTAVFGTAVDPRGQRVNIGGFAIGLTVTFDILAGGPVTGASMNPARSFGPALVQGHFDLHWCYWVAPIVGAVIAALVYEHFLLKEDGAK